MPEKYKEDASEGETRGVILIQTYSLNKILDNSSLLGASNSQPAAVREDGNLETSASKVLEL